MSKTTKITNPFFLVQPSLNKIKYSIFWSICCEAWVTFRWIRNECYDFVFMHMSCIDFRFAYGLMASVLFQWALVACELDWCIGEQLWYFFPINIKLTSAKRNYFRKPGCFPSQAKNNLTEIDKSWPTPFFFRLCSPITSCSYTIMLTNVQSLSSYERS